MPTKQISFTSFRIRSSSLRISIFDAKCVSRFCNVAYKKVYSSNISMKIINRLHILLVVPMMNLLSVLMVAAY